MMASQKQHQLLRQESILDTILERVTNLEHSSNRQNIMRNLDLAILARGKTEGWLRTTTVTLTRPVSSRDLNKIDISHNLEQLWSLGRGRMFFQQVWRDASSIFIELANQQEKDDFLEFIKTSSEVPLPIKAAVVPPNKLGQHFTRKPVRLMLYNVRSSMKIIDIEASLTRAFRPREGMFSHLKEGATSRNTIRGRNIFFRVNQEGFRTIFEHLHGVIPFLDFESQTRAKLHPRINCRPFVCKDCYKFGLHACKGRICSTCGGNNHQTKTCKKKTRFCSNCQLPGHRARDLHCPSYLVELTNELGTMDVPIEWLQSDEKRASLIKMIQMT